MLIRGKPRKQIPNYHDVHPADRVQREQHWPSCTVRLIMFSQSQSTPTIPENAGSASLEEALPGPEAQHRRVADFIRVRPMVLVSDRWADEHVGGAQC